MKLAGYKDSTIIKQGRWSPESTTFLEYIQNQLSTFTEGMARKMSKIKTFTNMEGTSRKEDLRHLMNVKVKSKKRQAGSLAARWFFFVSQRAV